MREGKRAIKSCIINACVYYTIKHNESQGKMPYLSFHLFSDYLNLYNRGAIFYLGIDNCCLKCYNVIHKSITVISRGGSDMK